MRRTTEDILIKCPLVAAAFYAASFVALMICFFTYDLGGAILYPVAYALNSWPLVVLQQIDGSLHSSWLGSDESYSNAFGRGQLINFAGWLLISPLLLVMIRRIKSNPNNQMKKDNKPEMATPRKPSD